MHDYMACEFCMRMPPRILCLIPQIMTKILDSASRTLVSYSMQRAVLVE